VPQARVVCPLSACRARKEFITNQLLNYLGVDAVLPADLGGAPHANRKLTKVRLSNALARYDKKRKHQKVGSACITAYPSLTFAKLALGAELSFLPKVMEV
jgi:hypothetical protein